MNIQTKEVCVSSSTHLHNSTVSRICFNCKVEGHFARNCPLKWSSAPVIDAQNIQQIWCPCAAGPCVIRTSGTKKNPDRKFYGCPAKYGKTCNYFKWCDEIEQYQHPICGCRAGVCRLITAESGRRAFVCPLPEGFGACEFYQWEDEGSKNDSDASSPSNEEEIVTKGNDSVEAEPKGSEPKQTSLEDLQSYPNVREDSLYNPKPLNTLRNNSMDKTIREAFFEASTNIQRGLVSVLESMDPTYCQSMITEANSAFVALDSLSVDYQSFRHSVDKFISSASSIAELRNSIPLEMLGQRLEDLKESRGEMLGTVASWKKNFQHIRQKLSYVKQRVVLVDECLSSCEDTLVDFENYFIGSSDDVSKFDTTFHALSLKVMLAIQDSEQREAQLFQAFIDARTKLRESVT